MVKNIFIALDSENIRSVETYSQLLDTIKEDIYGIKGNTLFLNPANVEILKRLNLKIFYDMKFHDIPKVVYNHVLFTDKLGVDYMTVMASGGSDMLKAAYDAGGNKVIAVTVLTSLSNNDAKIIYGYNQNEDILKKKVIQFAEMSFRIGIKHVVCSPLEIQIIKDAKIEMNIFTPGIRPLWWQNENIGMSSGQTRFTTPKDAIKSGADYIIIGSPIMEAKDIKKAVSMTIDEINDV